MILYNSYEMHIILLPCKISKERFLQQAKVRKDSYFYRIIESLYTTLTETTINLEHEYVEYYSEYDSFISFLYHKYPFLDNDKLEQVRSFLKTNKYNIFRGYFHKLSDYNFHNLIDLSDDFVEKINMLLKAEFYED